MTAFNNENREIIIGALTIVMFVIIFALVTSKNKGELASSIDMYFVTAEFNQVDGIIVGDEVRLAGIPIGYVKSAELNDRYNSTLTLGIFKNVMLPIDTSVAIHTNGLFGSKFISIEPGGDFEYLENGDELTFTQGAVILQELLELIISEGNAKLTQEASN